MKEASALSDHSGHAASPDRGDMDLEPVSSEGRPVFYGWYIALAVTGIAFVAWGVAFWNVGVFLYAFHDARGWSRSALSGGAALFSVVAGLTGFTVGRIVDRRGPRIVLLFGGLMTGLAMAGIGQVRELWQVYLFDALLAVGFACTHVLVLSALVARWFRRRRALAMTIGLTGSSAGGLVLVPLSTTLIARFGITTAATALALVAWGLVLPLTIFVVRNQPSDLGLWPDGDPGPAEAASTGSVEAIWTVRTALRTLAWWTITLAFMLTLLGQVAYLFHQVSFLTPRLGLAGAALAVSVTTIAGIIGRFGLGWIGDRCPKRWLAIANCLLQALGGLIAAQSDAPLVLYLTAGLVGLTIGNVVALQPLMMAEAFGVRSYGTVYGPAYLATQLGQACGPLLVGVLADLTGGYQLPFTVTASAAIVAAGLLFFGAWTTSPASTWVRS